MKISIVIPVLNSHEVVRRQILHFSRMNLPDTEIILVDDGSNPPIEGELDNLIILYTYDKRPWTQGLARNMGAREATGEYLLMTDIDHIISEKVIDAVYNYTGDRMTFRREIGVLDEDGFLRQDPKTLKEYGFDADTVRVRSHGNSFAIRRKFFFELGGYRPSKCVYGYHAEKNRGEDCYFNAALKRYVKTNPITSIKGPPLYLFPVGRYNATGDNNPKGLFHGLSYEPTQQPRLK